jgi:hypothetical protein
MLPCRWFYVCSYVFQPLYSLSSPKTRFVFLGKGGGSGLGLRSNFWGGS